MASPSVASLLAGLAASGKAYESNEAGAREALIEQSRALVAALEIPSEFIQRSFWAEVSWSCWWLMLRSRLILCNNNNASGISKYTNLIP